MGPLPERCRRFVQVLGRLAEAFDTTHNGLIVVYPIASLAAKVLMPASANFAPSPPARVANVRH